MSDESIYGVDIKLVRRRDGLWDVEEGVNGDFTQVSGKDTAVQLIMTALTIAYGELKLHPDFGCHIHSLVGEPPTPILQAYLRVFTYESLMKLSIVEDVYNVDCYLDENDSSIININMNVKLISKVKKAVAEAHTFLGAEKGYQLNNPNIITVEEIRGYVDGNIVSFTKDVDYNLNGDTIVFIGRTPTARTTFLVDYYYFEEDKDYEPQSIILTYPFKLSSE